MGLSRAPEGRPTPKEVYNYRIYLLTICVCLGSWMFGYNNGIIGGVLVLPSFYRDFNLPPVGTSSYNTITANIVSFLQIGGLCGAMATFPLMKKFGRRIALIVAAGIYTLGAALQVCFFLENDKVSANTNRPSPMES
jgi:MFS family permease